MLKIVIGPIKRIRMAQEKVLAEIRGNAQHDGRFSGALAGEGYAGGYLDALFDVLLILNGVGPDRRGYWKAGD